MATHNPVSRRRFLRGLGTTALAVPFLNGILQRISDAQEGEIPLRFYVMFTGNGHLPSHWTPTGSENDFTLSPVLEPLAPVQSKLLLARGLRGLGPHAEAVSGTLTGKPSSSGIATGGPSIDQFIAAQWAGSTPVTSIELGVVPSNLPEDQTFYSPQGLPVPTIGSPVGVFGVLTGATNQDPATAQRILLERRSVLDSVSADIAALQGRLGGNSRVLLDEHLTLLRAQEKLLENPPPPVSCDMPGMPSASVDIRDMWKAQHDNIVTAFRCGITRVAGLRAGGQGGIESGYYDVVGVRQGHHSAAHGGGSDPSGDLIKINRFHAEQLSALAQALDAVPEGDGTLLDYSIILWVTEFGLGGINDHGREDVEITLVGGSKAGFKNGTFLQMKGTNDQHFLYTLAQIAKPDVDKFGTSGTQVVTEMLT